MRRVNWPAFWRGFKEGLALEFLWRPAFAWALYWLGDLASTILNWRDHSERWCGFWYPTYNTLMGWSVDVQGGWPGPWKRPQKDER